MQVNTSVNGFRSLSVSFSSAPPKSFIWRSISLARELFSRVSWQSFSNAASIYKEQDLSRPFAQSWQRGSYISEFPSLMGTVYVTADPRVMQAIFAHPRKSEVGPFFDIENRRLFVEGILNDIYPVELQEIGVDNAVDMLVISAAHTHAAMLRAPMVKALGPAAISGHAPTLKKIAQELLSALSEEEKARCNASDLSFEYAVTVISKLFTGYETTRTNYQELATALDAFSKRMTRIIAHAPGTPEEQAQYQVALIKMRELLDEHMSSQTPFIQGLKDAGWNEFQIKATLFFTYFAGTETTASLTNYLIWQLGREENQHLQDTIRGTGEGNARLLKKAVAEALRMNPPAFIEGRQLRENTVVTVSDSAQNIVLEKELRKGHSIVCLTQAAASDPLLYPDPEMFNPHRFKEENLHISQLSFLPFARGHHMCVGQYLALAEIQTLVAEMVNQFSLRTLSPAVTTQKGFFTLRATAAIVELAERKDGGLA